MSPPRRPAPAPQPPGSALGVAPPPVSWSAAGPMAAQRQAGRTGTGVAPPPVAWPGPTGAAQAKGPMRPAAVAPPAISWPGAGPAALQRNSGPRQGSTAPPTRPVASAPPHPTWANPWRTASPAIPVPGRGIVQRSSTAATSAATPSAAAAKLKFTDVKCNLTKEGMALSGRLSDGRDVKGSVYLPTFYIDTSGNAETPPIPAASATASDRNNWTQALRVQNITAEPNGMKFGDFLAYQVGVRAGELGITHILAMTVVPKARNFYSRLGFTDYNAVNSYGSLLKRTKWLEDEVRRINTAKEPTDTAALMLQIQQYRNEMAQATMMVPVATLRTKAVANWRSKWRQIDTGWEET